MKIKKDIIKKLKNFTNVITQFVDKDTLLIRSVSNKYKIEILFWEKEHTVTFGNWHWHFTNNDVENVEMLNTILKIINNQARIKNVFINGKLKNSELEFENYLEELDATMITGFFNITFFKKKVKEEVYIEIEF